MSTFRGFGGAQTGTTTTGFAFGTPRTATPAFGNTAQPSGSITFGTPVASVAPTPQTGLSFGTPQAQNLSFGTPQAQNLSFGAPSTSLSFGTPTASTGLAFGTPAASTGLPFGTPAPSTGMGFGTPAQPTGLSFGTPATSATTGFGFSAPALTSTSLAFGASQTGSTFGTPQTGSAFGTPQTASAFGTPQTASAFGTPQTASAFGNPQTASAFGTPQTASAFGTPQTGSTFGTPPTGSTFGAPQTGSALNFNAPTSTSMFGTPAAGTGLSFGVTTAPSLTGTGLFNTSSSIPSTGLNFSLGSTTLSLGATPASQASSGLSFGTTTTPSTGFGFGTQSTGLNLGGGTSSFSFKPATTTPTLSLGLKPLTTITTSAQPPSIGLGGVDNSQKSGLNAGAGRTDNTPVKETTIPNEITQTVENFKTFVKEQKALSSDVSRGSVKPMLKIYENADVLNNTLQEVGNDLLKYRQLVDKLKHDTAKGLHEAEMAQRTNDTPPGMQFENTAPTQFFVDLVNRFAQDLQALRQQIELTDKHIQSLNEPKTLTSQELSVGMRKLHETFVALAGRLQSVHSQVESQKERYLNLRKYILKDPTNVFVKQTKEDAALETVIKSLNTPKPAPGPTPFSSMGNQFEMGGAGAQLSETISKPPPAYPATSAMLSFGATTQTTAAAPTTPSQSVGLFGSTPAQSPSDSSFQLQKPPIGSKRGKH